MLAMSSEIERIAREIGKKPVSEIENTVQEIKDACDRFVKLNADLVCSKEVLDQKTTDKIAMIGNVLKDFRVKSAGIREAWRLNERQFKDGGLERDAYEKKLRELTQDMASLKFDFDKCAIEVKAFEKQITSVIQGKTESTHQAEKRQAKLAVVNSQTGKSIIPTEKEEIRDKNTFDDQEAYIKIGLSYAQSGKPEKAKDCFVHALNQAEATRCYQRVLEINSEHKEALGELGYSYGQMGNHKRAGQCFKRLIDIDPNNGCAWVGMGVASYSQGRFKQAKEYIEKALQIDPQMALAWYNLGLVYSSLGYLQESERCFDKAKALGYIE
jgi:tetratricopeptide (TPR) repeat protein